MATSSLALSGLASGVDTSSIVEQLIALDRQGTTRIQNRQYGVTGMQTALKDIASKLATLKSAANALTGDANWKPTQTVESTDTRVAVSQAGGAGIGGHTVQVDRLASSMQRGFSSPVSDFVDTQTGGNGIIDGRLKSADRNKKTLQDQLTQANERIDAKEKRLKAQFAAMETALQNSQTQQAWLTAQLAGLGSSSG